MIMKKFLLVSAILEISISLILLALPELLVLVLFGGVLDSLLGLAVARLAGAAILSLGVVCWFGRRDAQSLAAAGIAKGMLLYNIAAAVLFLSLRYAGMPGMGLLPGAAVHAALAGWSIFCLRKN